MTEQEHNNVQWRKVKLGDCCSINPKTDISKVQNDDIVSFVKMEDVSNDGFITSFSERPYKSLQKKGFTIFQNDDVIFAKITPCMENGKGALVRNMKSKICLGSTEFHVLRACANVSIDFIYQLTISKRFRQRAEMQMTGSAGQQRVPTAFLEDCLISIPFKNNKPDLSAQRRIAAILASADKVIVATQKIIAKYKQIKQGMMEDLLNEQCSMNNVQWRKVRLGEVCAVNPKTDTTKVLDDDFVTFVRMEDVSNDGLIASFSERPYKSLQKKGFTIFQNDDVIFAKITPCMENGKGALVRNMKSKICMGSTEFHVLRACDNVSIDFIYQLTISKQFRQRAEMQMTGSAGQQRVPTAFLEDYLISIPFKNDKPDLTEQRRIAAILSGIDAKIAAEEKVLEKYEKVKKGLMERLLNEQ